MYFVLSESVEAACLMHFSLCGRPAATATNLMKLAKMKRFYRRLPQQRTVPYEPRTYMHHPSNPKLERLTSKLPRPRP
jgi:hypothetical protein